MVYLTYRSFYAYVLHATAPSLCLTRSHELPERPGVSPTQIGLLLAVQMRHLAQQYRPGSSMRSIMSGSTMRNTA